MDFFRGKKEKEGLIDFSQTSLISTSLEQLYPEVVAVKLIVATSLRSFNSIQPDLLEVSLLTPPMHP